MGLEPALRLFGRARHSENILTRGFPLPELLYPRSAGIDISDASIKWVVLDQRSEEKVTAWGEEVLPEGIVTEGLVRDVPALAEALGKVKAKLGSITTVHAALPEEAAYIFDMHVPENTPRKSVLSMIEFELEGRVPISPTEAVYDYDRITTHDSAGGEQIGVTVFPRELPENYAAAFDMAGIRLLSLEVEARSVARAISDYADKNKVVLVVDFGRMRTGFAVLKNGVPIFSSTVAVGGVAMTRALVEKAGLTPEEAEQFKDEKGLLLGEKERSPGTEVLVGTASALADEVLRHYRYWDTKRNDRGERVTPVEEVLLVGGSANLRGLSDYISARVQAPAVLPNVWRHVCTFDEYIPPIDRQTSMQYVTAIGLALRGM